MRPSPESLVTGWLVIGLALVLACLLLVGASELFGWPWGIDWLVGPLQGGEP